MRLRTENHLRVQPSRRRWRSEFGKNLITSPAVDGRAITNERVRFEFCPITSRLEFRAKAAGAHAFEQLNLGLPSEPPGERCKATCIASWGPYRRKLGVTGRGAERIGMQ